MINQVATNDAPAQRPIDLVRARLEEHGSRIVSDRGDSFMAQCPGHHPDRTPSLHVSVGEDDRVLLHDHGGCELDAVLESLNLEFFDLFSGPCYKEGSSNHHVNPRPCPCNSATPCNNTEEGSRPELYKLLDAYARGRLEPEEVLLGELPARANEDDRRVADDLRLLIGLRRADGDTRPLPYATRFCAARMGWGSGGHVRASRVLGRLGRWGVINKAGELERRSMQPRGTMTFQPPLPEWPHAVERESVLVKAEIQPTAEVLDQPRVDWAGSGAGEHVRPPRTRRTADRRRAEIVASPIASLDRWPCHVQHRRRDSR